MDKSANTCIPLLFKSFDPAVSYLTEQTYSSGQNLWPTKETTKNIHTLIIQYSLIDLDGCISVSTHNYISSKVIMNFCSFLKASISDEMKK